MFQFPAFIDCIWHRTHLYITVYTLSKKKRLSLDEQHVFWFWKSFYDNDHIFIKIPFHLIFYIWSRFWKPQFCIYFVLIDRWLLPIELYMNRFRLTFMQTLNKFRKSFAYINKNSNNYSHHTAHYSPKWTAFLNHSHI